MTVYVRRFTTDPGNDVLLEIESVNILDLEPPSSITGIGVGVACLVGEFEKGEFNTPTEVTSADQLMSDFGMLGYSVGGVESSHPCARTRTADGALTAEKWNGNGFVQLNGKKFKRLVLVRVDTSNGAVEFTRVPYLTGVAGFSYDLEPGQILAVKLNGAAAVNATFDAAAGTVTGAAATYAFTGGETLVLGYDSAPNFTVTFLSTDTTVAAVVARINLYAGFTFASNSGGQVQLTGRQRGTGAQVRVVSATLSATAKAGLTVATTAGTGDVANIDAVTFTEVKTVVEADVAGTLVEQDANGKLRISNIGVTSTSIEIANTTTADGLGFTEASVATATSGTAGIIPAGTIVTNAGGTVTLVTMQDVAVTATSVGPYTAKVRHATDDGTGISAAALTMTKVSGAISLDAFKVTNAQIISAAHTESAIDVLYQTALDSTLDDTGVAAEINLIWSARQSNAVRRALKENAKTASSDGLAGRIACVRPPLGTLKASAQSTVAEPGVGAYRSDRVVYCYPGASTYVPKIAARGVAGGTGFTADGIVDIGADGFMVSVLSQLNPEENPGQETKFLDHVLAIESTLRAPTSTQTLKIGDYKNFKAKGIAALRVMKGKATFYSGCTAVDPLVSPSLKNIARRRMADYIQDTLAIRGTAFGKQLNIQVRRIALVGEIRVWLRSLLSPNEPSRQRIAGYTVDEKTGNTKELLASGLYKIIIKVKTLSSLDSIVLATTIGEQVEVEEQLAA